MYCKSCWEIQAFALRSLSSLSQKKLMQRRISSTEIKVVRLSASNSFPDTPLFSQLCSYSSCRSACCDGMCNLVSHFSLHFPRKSLSCGLYGYTVSWEQCWALLSAGLCNWGLRKIENILDNCGLQKILGDWRNLNVAGHVDSCFKVTAKKKIKGQPFPYSKISKSRKASCFFLAFPFLAERGNSDMLRKAKVSNVDISLCL